MNTEQEAKKVIEAAEVVKVAEKVVETAKQASGDELKSKYREYARSMALTFVAGMVGELLMNWDAIDLATIQDGTAFGIVFMAVRTGLRLTLEGIILFVKPRLT